MGVFSKIRIGEKTMTTNTHRFALWECESCKGKKKVVSDLPKRGWYKPCNDCNSHGYLIREECKTCKGNYEWEDTIGESDTPGTSSYCSDCRKGYTLRKLPREGEGVYVPCEKCGTLLISEHLKEKCNGGIKWLKVKKVDIDKEKKIAVVNYE